MAKKQRRHTRTSKKGKTFTAGQSAAIGAAAFVGTRVGGRIIGHIGAKVVERMVVQAAGRGLRAAVGRRRKFATRALHNRPTLQKALGKGNMAKLQRTEEGLIKFLRKNLPR